MRRDAEAVSTHETRSLPVEFSTDQMVMAFKEWFHELRKASDQRERRRQNSPVFHFIQYISRLIQSFFFYFFFMELPLWNAERGEINEYCFLVPSTWQNKIICTEGTRALASSPQEPSISFIQGILFSAKRDPLII